MKNEVLVGTTSEVKFDHTRVTDYSRLVSEEIEEYSNIEVTDELREGGIHAQRAWVSWFQYLSKNVWKTSLNAEIIQFANGIEDVEILSLGCGYGGVELEVAKALCSRYRITAVDINSSIFAKARREAREKNLNIEFLPLDINFLRLREQSFDVIMAHASLHHMLNLEHVFGEIYRGLKDNGRLIVEDVIGKTQVLFWKPNVDFAIELVRSMPAKYSAGIELPPYAEPSIQVGMEGVRQEEIEPLLNDYFVPLKTFKYGSFMRMICTHPQLGNRFDVDDDEDRRYLEEIFKLDVEQVERGKLKATEILAVYEKRRGIDMRAIEAKAAARLKADTIADVPRTDDPQAHQAGNAGGLLNRIRAIFSGR